MGVAFDALLDDVAGLSVTLRRLLAPPAPTPVAHGTVVKFVLDTVVKLRTRSCPFDRKDISQVAPFYKPF